MPRTARRAAARLVAHLAEASQIVLRLVKNQSRVAGAVLTAAVLRTAQVNQAAPQILEIQRHVPENPRVAAAHRVLSVHRAQDIPVAAFPDAAVVADNRVNH